MTVENSKLQRKIARKVRKKYGACQVCGCTNMRELTAHHKDRNRHNNEDSNLTCLCKSCHGTFHQVESDRGIDFAKVNYVLNFIEPDGDGLPASYYQNFIRDDFKASQPVS